MGKHNVPDALDEPAVHINVMRQFLFIEPVHDTPLEAALEYGNAAAGAAHRGSNFCEDATDEANHRVR
jgi:hypothetical protein